MPFLIPVFAAIAAMTATELLIVGAVIAFVGSLVLSKKMGAPPAPTTPEGTYVSNPLELTLGTEVPRRMVYGKSRISGVVAYANISGDGHEFLWFVVVIAAHAIDNISAIYFDGEEGSVSHAGFYEWWWHDGTQTTVDATLNAQFTEWDATCILTGCSYAVVKLKYDKDVWKNGRPNISFDVRGKKDIYDPRSGTFGFTNNAALVLADYMTSPDGLQATDAEMDWDTVAAAAEIAAQLPAQMASSLCDGRYQVDGVVELTTKPGDIVNAMMACLAGAVVWSEGKFRIYAGAMRDPVFTIQPGMLRDAPSIQPRAPSDQSFNSVKGTFLDMTNNWQFSDFPPIVGAPYVTQDGGVKVFKDIVLQFTTSPIMAQRLATIMLRRHRLEKTIQLPCKVAVFNLEVWDVVNVNLPMLGWVNRQFQITDWKFSPPTNDSAGGVDLTLIEYADDIFNDDMDVKPISGGGVINVPNVTIPAPIPTLFATSNDTTLDTDGNPQIRFDWASSPDIYAVGYELAWGPAGFAPADGDWTFVSGRSSFTYLVGPFIAGTTMVGYIRVVNSFDKRSTETASGNVIVKGSLAQVPEVLSSLTAVNANAEFVDLSWAAPTNSVAQQVEVRWGPTNVVSDSVVIARPPVSSGNTIRVERQPADGYFFASFISAAGIYGGFDDVAAVGRVPATVIQHMTLDSSILALTGAVWVTQNRAVCDSNSLAVDCGWELFDTMVPNPVLVVSGKARSSVFSAGGDIRTSGSLGWNRAPDVPGTLPIIKAGTEVAYFASTVHAPNGVFTEAESANLKLEFSLSHTDPNGVSFTSFNATLEQL
jgi:hypothetical protein